MAVSRATLYRRRARQVAPPAIPKVHTPPPRSLTGEERAKALAVLTGERFCDQAPRQVYATLLDEGLYLCSVRTMYRLLATHNAVRERRNQLRHPSYSKPELLATQPNEVWSWDITKLLGPVKWTYYYLYVVLDIYSRYVVGWMVAERESACLAKQLIESTIRKQGIEPGQLTVHADRGSPMKSGVVGRMLSALGVAKTHSRPHVPNDNPFSESQFKTMKYRPEFPARFSSFGDAHSFCRQFFGWYNAEHRHSGIGLHTPESVHYRRAQAVDEVRRRTLLEAFAARPDRFVRKAPQPPVLPAAVWINPPERSRES